MKKITFDVDEIQIVTVYFSGGNKTEFTNLKDMKTEDDTLTIEYWATLGQAGRHLKVARVNLNNVDCIDNLTTTKEGD